MANHLSYEVLNNLVEGRRSMHEAPRTQRHLASCGRCRSELEWLERVHGIHRRAPHPSSNRQGSPRGGNFSR
jgi:hypothetical protein